MLDSRRERIIRAKTGLLPPLLIAITRGERSTMAGSMTLQSSGLSTTFTGRSR
ncbi:hypothetical protein GCM10027567_27500 [Spongiibacter taiwanensis]